MSGVYWGLSALYLMNKADEVNTDEIIDFIRACLHDNGGYSGNIGHDPHLLYTLSAVQILCILDRLDVLDKEKTINFIVSLQQPDGSFTGDEWGEIDTRFSYCAVTCLSLLGALHRIDTASAIQFLCSCKNFDAGYGSVPGAESHSGQSKTLRVASHYG